ncbi:MAG: FRG domain-containing protein [Saprospiraceae bacterium]|nr:FRG domain-containing protein [Saprospiraceae bacterium]
MPTNFETTVKSWDELRSKLTKMGNTLWYFRGHANSAWALQPKLERAILTFQEKELFDEFKRTAHLYTTDTNHKVETKVEWLSLMQHHGAPTRLLDWTRSPYVAAFFAVNDLQMGDDTTAAVWAVNISEIFKEIRKKNEKDIRFKSLFNRNYLLQQTLPDEDFGSIFLSEWYIEEDFKFPSAVLPIAPYYAHPRLTIQQGVYLAQSRLFKDDEVMLVPFEDALRDTMEGEFDARWIQKFYLPSKLRPQMLRELNAMNINDATLFPGLDGFAKFLAKKVSVLLDEIKSGVEEERDK